MINRKIYTPEGLNDILHDQCFLKKNLESTIRDVFRGFGYRELEPPTVEYYDVFSVEEALLSQETMFKFFDQQGRILVLRPDLTIPVGRITATKLKEKKSPIRNFYIGNTYSYNELGGGKQKEYTQAGAEIIGIDNKESDAEVIVTAIKAIKSTGLENFQIDIGQIEFFKGLMEETNLDETAVEQLRALIDSKDYLGIEELVNGYNLKKELKELILDLPKFFGSIDVIEKAEKITSNEKSLSALKRLRDILEIIEDYDLSKYVSVDLGMVPSLKYYTSVIFKAFTYGVGFPILSGGRYDKLLSSFGDNRSATGFSLGINLLMMALERQKIKKDILSIDTLVCYKKDGRKTAFKIANELRKQGLSVEMDISCSKLENIKNYAKREGIGGLIEILNENDINVYNLIENKKEKTSIKKLLGKN